MNRRGFITGLIAAPAIVRLPSLMLMPRSPWPPLICSPGGLLTCNGALVRARDYPELFSVLGTLYGGDSLNFRLPDMASSNYLITAKPGQTGPVGMLLANLGKNNLNYF